MISQIGAAALEAALDQESQKAFGEFHDVVERGVGDFGLDHPELGEVAAGLGFFRAEGWAERIDLAERHGGGFDVELAGLRQVRLLFEVVDGKQRGGPFAGGGRQDGRIGQRESVAVEEIAGGANDFGADAQDGCLALRAQPEMAVLHQEVDAVLFGRDRIRSRFRHALHDLDVGDVEFIAAGSALIGADFAFDDDARFLRQALDGVKDFGRTAFFGDYALNHAGAVAKWGKSSLPLSRRL